MTTRPPIGSDAAARKLDALEHQTDALVLALDALHTPSPLLHEEPESPRTLCAGCLQVWPCATNRVIRALLPLAIKQTQLARQSERLPHQTWLAPQ